MRSLSIGLAAFALLAAAIWQVSAQDRPAAKGNDAMLIKHGEYLVTEVAHCGHCHTPQDAKGQPDQTRLLQGATLPFLPKEKTTNWAGKSPDITRSGLAGEWSEADMIKFLTTGLNPEDMKSMAPMPVFRLHKEDARAVALYLKSLPGKKGTSQKSAGRN